MRTRRRRYGGRIGGGHGYYATKSFDWKGVRFSPYMPGNRDYASWLYAGPSRSRRISPTFARVKCGSCKGNGMRYWR